MRELENSSHHQNVQAMATRIACASGHLNQHCQKNVDRDAAAQIKALLAEEYGWNSEKMEFLDEEIAEIASRHAGITEKIGAFECDTAWRQKVQYSNKLKLGRVAVAGKTTAKKKDLPPRMDGANLADEEAKGFFERSQAEASVQRTGIPKPKRASRRVRGGASAEGGEEVVAIDDSGDERPLSPSAEVDAGKVAAVRIIQAGVRGRRDMVSVAVRAFRDKTMQMMTLETLEDRIDAMQADGMAQSDAITDIQFSIAAMKKAQRESEESIRRQVTEGTYRLWVT